MKAGIVLKTKLTPYRTKTNMLRRSVLVKKLKRLNGHSLTLVQAGPGFGKSTAVASFLRDQGTAGCWYSIGPHDGDLFLFLTYVVYAIREAYPEFGDELLAHLSQGEHYVRDKSMFRLFDA